MSESKLIRLSDWASRHYDPPPSIRTLRQWARSGKIAPQPVLVGREYRIAEDAVYVADHGSHPQSNNNVLNSEDPIVNAIIRNGQTTQRRQA